MRKGAGHKVVIKLGPDGHYVYFSVHDDRDNGSIIDFVQQRTGFNLGKIRKELRAWSERPATSLPSFARLEITAKDRASVERRFYAMQIAARHPYLEDELSHEWGHVLITISDVNSFGGVSGRGLWRVKVCSDPTTG